MSPATINLTSAFIEALASAQFYQRALDIFQQR
jgi:hypothetical protein